MAVCLVCAQPISATQLGVNACRLVSNLVRLPVLLTLLWCNVRADALTLFTISVAFSACAAFFKRTQLAGRNFICRQGDKKCLVQLSMRFRSVSATNDAIVENKFACRSCRYAKCVRIGLNYDNPQRRQPRKPRSILDQLSEAYKFLGWVTIYDFEIEENLASEDWQQRRISFKSTSWSDWKKVRLDSSKFAQPKKIAELLQEYRLFFLGSVSAVITWVWISVSKSVIRPSHRELCSWSERTMQNKRLKRALQHSNRLWADSIWLKISTCPRYISLGQSMFTAHFSRIFTSLALRFPWCNT